jgi:dienelactone hydrolase
MWRIVCIVSLLSMTSQSQAADIPANIRPFFAPPAQYANDFGSYKSPLLFEDGTPVKTPSDWQKRRAEILATWHSLLGDWPPLLDKPKVQYLEQQHRDNVTQHKVTVEIAPGGQSVAGYLLVPDVNNQRVNSIRNHVTPDADPGPQSEIRNSKGHLPAVLVVFYDPETAVGLGKPMRDFGAQLARRGFVVLSIGTPEFCSLKPPYKPLCETPAGRPQLQPLSALAYVAANCHTALANLPYVDPRRIGVTGHSYGGKWAMFASCLYEKFACAVWSDPGIVFDETRPNINYWEPWYLGWDASLQRERGVPSDARPRTGPYKTMI